MVISKVILSIKKGTLQRKIRYLLEMISFCFRKYYLQLISFGHISTNGFQIISISCDFVVEEHGKIILNNINHFEKNVILKAVGGIISVNGVYMNRNVMLVSHKSIVIKKGTTIGPNVVLYDHDHNYDYKEGYGKFLSDSIVIEDDVWIGANVVILKGVHIGRKSVIAAGSIVLSDVPAYSLVAGNPAKIIKFIQN